MTLQLELDLRTPHCCHSRGRRTGAGDSEGRHCISIYNCTSSTLSYILLILLGPSVKGLSGEDVRWMTLEHYRGVPHEGILIGKFVGMWAMHDGKLKDGMVLGWAGGW